MNFEYCRKHPYHTLDELSGLPFYDYYIASFALSDRIRIPSSRIKSNKYIWFVTENDQSKICVQDNVQIVTIQNAEEDYLQIMELIKSLDLGYKRICIDATGFFIPNLLFLIRYLQISAITKFDILYTEPIRYKKAEDTMFSDSFYNVKQIIGLGGTHISQTENDVLIIAAGYDGSRISDVANQKWEAKKILLFGFPAMSASMFQENVYRAYDAESSLGSECFKDMDMNILAPAYDPFLTAQALKEYMNKHFLKKKYTNIYFAPLSSKPQALGMLLYYLWEEGWKKEMSFIYPICGVYYNDNTEGIARIWLYEFELPNC